MITPHAGSAGTETLLQIFNLFMLVSFGHSFLPWSTAVQFIDFKPGFSNSQSRLQLQTL